MKILKKLLIVLLMAIIIIPASVKAEKAEYKTLNLEKALTEEQIEHDLSNYSEDDNQVTIYMFRGRGCGYCKKFLTFLNSIVDDYGKYFKLVSYEVWYDESNSELMQEVSSFMEQPADGVPYIIIGDKVFKGYSENYDEDIKSQIKSLYNTNKKDRYDVMAEYKKGSPKEEENNVSFGFIAFNIIFTIILVSIVFVYNNKKVAELNDKISSLETKLNKKEK